MDARAVTLAFVVITAVAVAAVLGLPTAAADSDDGCVEVHHDVTTDTAVEHYDANEEVTTGAHNTKVTVSESSAFVQAEMENPNGYCVTFVVDVDDEIVDAAELGTVEALETDGVTGDWAVIQDLDTGAHHTRITATVPADETATLAPSKPRIMSLAWTGEAQDQADGWTDRLSGVFGDDLEDREYMISPPSNSSSVSVSFEDPDSDREIDDWQAMYTTDDGDTWHPVETDSDAPVAYTEHDDRVEFVFNDRDAEVEFVADPSSVDSAQYRVRSYASGLSEVTDLFDRIPLTVPVTNAGVAGGGVPW